jgi:hypothetical protein
VWFASPIARNSENLAEFSCSFFIRRFGIQNNVAFLRFSEIRRASTTKLESESENAASVVKQTNARLLSMYLKYVLLLYVANLRNKESTIALFNDVVAFPHEFETLSRELMVKLLFNHKK